MSDAWADPLPVSALVFRAKLALQFGYDASRLDFKALGADHYFDHWSAA